MMKSLITLIFITLTFGPINRAQATSLFEYLTLITPQTQLSQSKLVTLSDSLLSRVFNKIVSPDFVQFQGLNSDQRIINSGRLTNNQKFQTETTSQARNSRAETAESNSL